MERGIYKRKILLGVIVVSCKYRKKPVIVEAVEFQGFDSLGNSLFDRCPKWLRDELGESVSPHKDKGILTIQTLEGDHSCQIGDYIIKGVHNELYPCKPDIFRKTYEKVR